MRDDKSSQRCCQRHTQRRGAGPSCCRGNGVNEPITRRSWNAVELGEERQLLPGNNGLHVTAFADDGAEGIDVRVESRGQQQRRGRVQYVVDASAAVALVADAARNL